MYAVHVLLMNMISSLNFFIFLRTFLENFMLRKKVSYFTIFAWKERLWSGDVWEFYLDDRKQPIVVFQNSYCKGLEFT